jgi:formylglycine-generating enzyme required for sulfatase activity
MVRTDPDLVDEGKQSAEPLPDQTAAEEVMSEGWPRETDPGEGPESETVEQHKAEAVTIVEQPPVQADLNPGGKATEQSAENSPLQQQKKGEEFPGESPGYLEGDFIEVAIPDAEDVPLCPGKPAAEGLEAKVAEPSGKTFVDPVTGMSFVLVKGGCFKMGSSTGGSDEKPVHEVCVDDFYMGEYEVTQAQYEWIMRHNPSSFPQCDLPVESVSWEDAQAYIRKLSHASGRNYRLPSEAEWEYAARCGWKDEAEAAIDESLLMEYGGYIKNIGYQIDPVGPNALGLYDMAGNVWEWVRNRYNSEYTGPFPAINPTGPISGELRVLRSGSWFDSASLVRAANRESFPPGSRHTNIGFRCVIIAAN